MYQSKYDTVVVGGGLTGVAAAVAAARKGLNVLLIERDGCLGGAMSNGLVYPFMKYWLKQENEDVVNAFLQKHEDFYLENLRLPEVFPENTTGMLTLIPGDYDTDGFFISRLRRKA